MRKHWKKKVVIFVGVLLLCFGILVGLVWFGVIQLNGAAAKQFSVRGVDVSEYQGEIDCNVFVRSKDAFAEFGQTE